jgi:hypothetical protein
VTRLLPLLLLVGCSEWPATPAASFRRSAGAKHRSCVENNHCTFVSQCHRESEALCLDAGYEKSCGDDLGDVEGLCGSGVK